MKFINSFNSVSLGLLLIMVIACDNDIPFNSGQLPDVDTTGSLQTATEFPVGIGINANLMLNNTQYSNLVRQQFNQITLEYNMKQGAIVQGDGSYNYSTADNVLQIAEQSDMGVHGHTLVWHQNNNGDYLRSLVSGGGGGNQGPNLIMNGGFEGGTGNSFNNWSVYNDTDATFSAGSGSDEVRTGDRSLKIVNEADHPGEQWRVQIAADAIPTTVDQEYKVSFWIKAENEGGSGRLSTQPNALYQGDFSTATTWIPVSWTFTANVPETNIVFDMGAVANTYYIDDVAVREVGASSGNSGGNTLITNGSFEDDLNSWEVLNNTNAEFTTTNSGSDVYDGGTAMVVTNTGPQENVYDAQIVSPPFDVPVEVGEPYEISFWIKADQAGPAGRLSTREQPQYQGGADAIQASEVYTKVTWTLDAAVSGEQSVAFDMGGSENTYYVDYVEVKEPSSEGGGPSGQDSTNVANFLQDYITTTVDHFEGQVQSWDVVNEPIQDGTGAIRTNPTPGEAPEGDIFYWAEFLGEGYIPLAFEIVDQAAPDADLYLNDYNLETDPTKLEAFVNLADSMANNDVPIDGVGTQMHVNLNTSYSGIDRAFQQLASTGLQVKVTELDVKVNPDNISTFKLTDQALGYQQIMYNYVAWSYIQNVPADQRAGITVWNLKDDTSWIVTTQDRLDYPTLFDSTYTKKAAFSGFKKGLQGIEPNADN